MTETALALVADYGVIILFCVTFLSCLALPVPSSILMLASGSFAATGDLDIVHVAVAAFAGTVLGDNTSYVIAQLSGDRMRGWLDGDPKRAALHNKGAAFMTKWGGSSVFFSCWLVAPLGPYINYLSGLTKFTWRGSHYGASLARLFGSGSMWGSASPSAKILPPLPACWATRAG
jgi:membrane protein DedA with SNARE-associated domain